LFGRSISSSGLHVPVRHCCCFEFRYSWVIGSFSDLHPDEARQAGGAAFFARRLGRLILAVNLVRHDRIAWATWECGPGTNGLRLSSPPLRRLRLVLDHRVSWRRCSSPCGVLCARRTGRPQPGKVAKEGGGAERPNIPFKSPGGANNDARPFDTRRRTNLGAQTGFQRALTDEQLGARRPPVRVLHAGRFSLYRHANGMSVGRSPWAVRASRPEFRGVVCSAGVRV